MGPAPSKSSTGGSDCVAGYNRRDIKYKRAPNLPPLEERGKREPTDPHGKSDEDSVPDFDKQPTSVDSSDQNYKYKEEKYAVNKLESSERFPSEEIKEEQLMAKIEEDDDDPEVPLEELIETTLIYDMVKYINSNQSIELPDAETITDLEELTMKKLAWWFSNQDSDQFASGEAYESDSNVSNISGIPASLNSSEESDSEDFAGVDRSVPWTSLDEHPGAQLLLAKYRSGPGDTFANIFELRTEDFSWDDKDKELNAFCNLCNEELVGKSAFAAHVVNQGHKENMSGLERALAVQPETTEKKFPAENAESENLCKEDKAKLLQRGDENWESASSKKDVSEGEGDMMDGRTGDSKKDLQENEKANTETKPEKRKRSQESPSFEESDSDEKKVGVTTADLPGEISATALQESQFASSSQSEHPIPSSNSQARKRSRRCRSSSPASSFKCDEAEFREKLALAVEGKWNDEMENRWLLMEADKAKFSESFVERQKLLITTPEKHERYDQEWTAFWERRSEEVENEGLDPESYDYVPEWKEFWNRRMKVLLAQELDDKIKEIKKKYDMDVDTLAKLRSKQEAIPPVAVINLEPDQPSPVKLPPQPLTNTSLPLKPNFPETAGEFLTSGEVRCTTGDSTKPSATSSAKVAAQPSPASVVHIDGSSNDSSCVGSYDFDGYDIPQVLNLMVDVEDKLKRLKGLPSRFAERVQEYLKTAQKLELKNRYAAQKLLNNEEFVALMFTLHDRYMKRIRKNVLPRDVLGPLNHIVYALDAMMESPPCQKYRSKLTSGEATIGSDSEVEPEVKTVNPPVANRALTADEKIARLLAGFLMTNGMSTMTDSELRYFVGRMMPSLTPTAAESQAVSASSRNPNGETNAGAINVPAFSQLRIDPNGVPLQATAEPIYNRRTANVASSSAGSSFSYHAENYTQSSGPPGNGGRGRGGDRGNGGNARSHNDGWVCPPYRGWGRGLGINAAYTGNTPGETDAGTFNVPSFGQFGIDPNGVPAEPIYNRRTGNAASSSAGSSFSYHPGNYMQSSGVPGTSISGWGGDRGNRGNVRPQQDRGRGGDRGNRGNNVRSHQDRGWGGGRGNGGNVMSHQDRGRGGDRGNRGNARYRGRGRGRGRNPAYCP